MPNRGIEPASAACRSDALPTELHPRPFDDLNIISRSHGCQKGKTAHSVVSWTLTAELQIRIQAMEMRCYCKILRISYNDHVTTRKSVTRPSRQSDHT